MRRRSDLQEQGDIDECCVLTISWLLHVRSRWRQCRNVTSQMLLLLRGCWMQSAQPYAMCDINHCMTDGAASVSYSDQNPVSTDVIGLMFRSDWDTSLAACLSGLPGWSGLLLVTCFDRVTFIKYLSALCLRTFTFRHSLSRCVRPLCPVQPSNLRLSSRCSDVCQAGWSVRSVGAKSNTSLLGYRLQSTGHPCNMQVFGLIRRDVVHQTV